MKTNSEVVRGSIHILSTLTHIQKSSIGVAVRSCSYTGPVTAGGNWSRVKKYCKYAKYVLRGSGSWFNAIRTYLPAVEQKVKELQDSRVAICEEYRRTGYQRPTQVGSGLLICITRRAHRLLQHLKTINEELNKIYRPNVYSY